jgi:hypothetical protein
LGKQLAQMQQDILLFRQIYKKAQFSNLIMIIRKFKKLGDNHG